MIGSTGLTLLVELEDEAEKKRQYRRNKRFPAEQVRKRQSYQWFKNMLESMRKNTPEENLRLLHNQLLGNGGFYSHRGALVQYKVESMELVIEDYKQQNKQACP